MNARTSRTLAVTAAMLAISAAVASVAPRPVALPLTEPPLNAATANKVTSFAHDHPEFSPLRDSRKDATGIIFPHSKHLNRPDAVNAKDWKGEDRALNCLDCHQPEADGRYMKPVTFAEHCLVCHASNLGTIEVAEGVIKPVVTPHGDEAAIAAAIDAQFYQWAALSAAKPTQAGAPAEEPKPAATSRRGRGGGGDAPAKKAEFPDNIKSPEALTALLIESRDKQFKDLTKGTKCGYCHTVDKPDAKGSPFVVKNPVIPDQWLVRSVFSHGAHAMVACTACHAAESSASSADINLPSIASCRECHAPTAAGTQALGTTGAGDSCVECHIYHPKNIAPIPGTLLPKDLMRR